MSPVGFEIDDGAMARFVFRAAVAQAGGVWLLSGVAAPVDVAFEVRR